MRYIILVSHGTFAPGLHNAIGMMLGEREDIRSTSLKDGMDTETYKANVAALVADISAEDDILLLADIIGGSPLTNALNVLSEKGLLDRTVAIGGMNFPMVMTAAFAEEDAPLSETAEEAIGEAKEQIRRFGLENDSDDEI